MSEALKPCPFCGHPRIDFIVAGWMRCRKCGTRGPIDTIDWPNDKIDAARTEAQRLWNRRAPATLPTVEELTKVMLDTPFRAVVDEETGGTDHVRTVEDIAKYVLDYLTRRMGGES